ncbi:hypothetical protein CHH28_02460 [Bacterioplanes sanyensis]|uniref:DUF1145 domain-containing protein n=1 Tax=Bacterioplanes sanyensis TaxID=1249553 RepID=A0A222FGN8_9GAMM|nr:hypothetical protein [Bacterioplanes sanyensis]ASP37601.1 hypothetical protein CHH28_02460 [Bacterioplanes sanyensis]
MLAWVKAGTLVFWGLALTAWLLNWSGLLAWLPAAALLIAAIHALEVAYFWLRLKQHSPEPEKDALHILVFGVFHMQRFMRT